MATIDIPLDEAELLSALLGGLLYGCSLPMFGGTIWALSAQRSTSQVNRGLLTVACLLLLCSTVHVVICIIRTIRGLILFRYTFPGGSIGYFSDPSQWTFVSKNYVYTVQTLIGDGVILYRCYAVWRSKLVMILPVLLWCAVVVTGLGTPYAESRATQSVVFEGSLSHWIISFWASTLTTNLLTTILLAYRIWTIDQKATSLPDRRKSLLRLVLHVVIEAGVIYSVTLLAALICFINRSNGQFVILDMITPIISITFYMVIIRVALATRANQKMNTPPHGYTITGNSISGDRRSRIQVHTMGSVENNADNDRRSSMSARASIAVENNRWNRIQLDYVAEEV